VTNGIAARRLALPEQPGLTKLVRDAVGATLPMICPSVSAQAFLADDVQIGQKVLAAKRENKHRLFDFIAKLTNTVLSPDAICEFRSSVCMNTNVNTSTPFNHRKYLHNSKPIPQAEVAPRVFFFGAKAAPGYYFAKQVIKLLCTWGVRPRRRPAYPRPAAGWVFLEDYRVTLSELYHARRRFSHQLSLAGTRHPEREI
jgi:starch phosphorylase